MTQSVSLFPTFPTPRTVSQRRGANPTIHYHKGWKWNFVTMDFDLNPDGTPVECDGYENWVQWCVFAVITDRYVYASVPRFYGVELGKIAQMDPEEAKAHIVRGVTEALMIDRRTGGVENFVFEESADGLHTTFTPYPANPAAGPGFTLSILIP